MTTAEARFKAAVRAIIGRGEYPSPGAIQREQGRTVTHNVNGRETRWRSEVLLASGWRRVEGADSKQSGRTWEEPSPCCADGVVVRHRCCLGRDCADSGRRECSDCEDSVA